MNWKADPIVRQLVQQLAPTRYLGAEISHVFLHPLGCGLAVWLTGAPEPVVVSFLDLYQAGWRLLPVEENPCPSP